MPKAIVVHRTGGPEVLELEDFDPGLPGPGEVRIRQMAIGLNFLDTYYRSGLYPAKTPLIPGGEGAGEVVATGEGVGDFAPGDRVAYVFPLGAYAEERNVPASHVVKLPGAIDFETAAAAMLKGLTAEFLLHRTFPVQAGQTILFHAAAGGVGLIACQWARHLGARVIGTVGSDDKVPLALAHGCDEVIQYRREDFVARVKEITGGKRCAVVYDGVGKATFPGSLDCLQPFGMYVNFGNASGPVENVSMVDLGNRGSLYATRPTLFSHISRRPVLEAMAENLFSALENGVIHAPVSARFPLSRAADAHRALESRATTGSAVLLPDG
ncbi:quinone oxidoreductase family protein [Camelimonas lactis]|uniref:NADPH2:quinone reductase n=1 Tax=Camelimonas lactis TaxID=659006 RepID=A0A4V2RWU8_9HYPH|nr:quinone oxidoreductase [Camelimonas lactis]TCO10321.1 NADPH2:quinone reductase [Camelimonas lactis]